jgi:hypothetical protein
MATVRVKDLPNELASAGANDLLVIEDMGADETKKIKPSGVMAGMNVATTSVKGLMSAADKTKHDAIASHTDGSGAMAATGIQAAALGDGLGKNSGTGKLEVKPDGATLVINGIAQVGVKAGGVGSTQLADDAVTTGKIADGAVVSDHINAAVIGSGLDRAADGDPISVKVDDHTIEINGSNELQVADGSISAEKLDATTLAAELQVAYGELGLNFFQWQKVIYKDYTLTENDVITLGNDSLVYVTAVAVKHLSVAQNLLIQPVNNAVIYSEASMLGGIRYKNLAEAILASPNVDIACTANSWGTGVILRIYYVDMAGF